MITRNYKVKDLNTAMLFCPNCHREITLPFKGNSIKCENAININCGNCNNGRVTIKVIGDESV